MATESLACIEKEIAIQQVALSNLYSRRNTFSPVFRLPTEVLTWIFISCALDHYRCEPNVGNYTPRPCTWFHVSHVCRHWRNVALNSPTLWSYITLMPSRWIEEQLIRSKSAPLKVYVTGLERFRPTLEKVLNHMERIQELTLRLPNDSDAVCKILPMLFVRSPLLHHLAIICDHPVISSNIFSAPFDHDTPALCVLELRKCPLSWHLLKLDQLTVLRLDGAADLRPQQNMQDVITALGSMQTLSHLFLLNALPHAPAQNSSHPTPNTLQKISLPHLSRLQIDDSIPEITAFLACVDLPSHTEVRLGCSSGNRPSTVDYTILSSILARRFYTTTGTALSAPAIRSLIIECNFGWQAMRLIFRALDDDVRPCGSESDMSWDSNIPLCIRCRGIPYDLAYSKERIIGDICSSIPLTDVGSLHVIKPPTKLDFWKRILGHLQALQYLKLSCGDMPALASILSRNSVEHGDSNQVLVPVLEELELDDMMFAAPDVETGTLGAGISSLEDALSTREGPKVCLEMIDCREYDSEEEDSELHDGNPRCGVCGCYHDGEYGYSDEDEDAYLSDNYGLY